MFGEVLAGRLVGSVSRPKGQVREERAVRANRLGVVDELNGVLDEVFAEVIPLFDRALLTNAVIVVDQIRSELIGFAVEESVETVEPTREGPLIKRARGRGVFH